MTTEIMAAAPGGPDRPGRDDPGLGLSSTRYALAAEGQEYVVFQPDEGEFTVELAPGTYAVEWFSLPDRSWTDGEAVSVADAGTTALQPPSSGLSVVHLRRQVEVPVTPIRSDADSVPDRDGSRVAGKDQL